MEAPASRDLHALIIGDASVALVAEAPLVRAETLARDQRGDALIAAVQAARLGAVTAFVTRVGDDVFGDWLLESWEAEGLHLDFARRCHGRNALLLASRADGPHRAVAYREGSVAAQLDDSDVDGLPYRRARTLFASGATQALGPSPSGALLRAFERAREAGVETIFDPSLRAGLWPGADGDRAAQAAFDALLPLTDVLVVGAPYASGKLLGQAGAADAARAALHRGVRRVVVRDSGRGAVVGEAGRVARLEASGGEPLGNDAIWPPAAFDGALVAALAAGDDLAEAGRRALAALAASRSGRGRGFDRLARELPR